MPAADMTPEREEQLTADLLRERAGIDPGNAGQLADLAAIGLVNGAWRNTCVENWHAQRREPQRREPQRREPRRRDSHRRQVAGRSTSPGWLDGGGPSGPAEARGPVIRGNSPGSPKQVRLTRPDVQAAVTVVGCPHVVGAMGVLVCRRRRDTERDIRPIDLTGADLTAADLTAAYLTAANLARANLTRTNLRARTSPARTSPPRTSPGRKPRSRSPPQGDPRRRGALRREPHPNEPHRRSPYPRVPR